MSYVYQYIDSTTGLPFYIGKGTGRRKDQHLADARKALGGSSTWSRGENRSGS
jgi:hypothetical protein